MKVIIDLDTGDCDDDIEFEELADLIQEAFDSFNWSGKLLKIVEE